MCEIESGDSAITWCLAVRSFPLAGRRESRELDRGHAIHSYKMSSLRRLCKMSKNDIGAPIEAYCTTAEIQLLLTTGDPSSATPDTTENILIQGVLGGGMTDNIAP